MKTIHPADRIRLACGLTWRGRRPGWRELRAPARNAALVLGLVALYGLVGRLDYEAARAAELEARARALAARAALADEMSERARLARLDAEYLEDYVIACLRGDREWVLGGQRWACQAKSVGPYIPQEN